MRPRPGGRRAAWASTAAVAAGLLSLSLRLGAAGPLAWPALALAWRGVHVAPTGVAAFAAAGLPALAFTSAAAMPLFALHPAGGGLAAVAFALPFTLPLLLARRLARAGAARGHAALAFVAAWLALERLAATRAVWGEFAYPLLTLGHALSDGPWLAAAGWSGVRGLSALLLAGGMLLAGVRHRCRARPAPVAAFIVVTGLPLVVPIPAAEPVRSAVPVRLVQPALDERQLAASRLSATAQRERVAFLAEASRGAPGMVAWPEGALPGPVAWPLEVGRPGALPAGVPVLLGNAVRRQEGLFNGVLAWRAGALSHVADKRVRVPGRESHLRPGRAATPALVGGIRWGALVCWDAAHADLARAAARAGAGALLVVANDAFDARGGSAAQHVRVARTRAAAVGLPLAFASQTGPSALVAADGRVTARTEAGARTTLDGTLRPGGRATPYRRFGDVAGWLGLLATPALAWRARPGRLKGGDRLHP